MLIVEDGSMPPGANCYADIQTVDIWQAARGSSTWPVHADAGTEDPNKAKKEAAIILATDYLNGLRWKGKKAASGRVMAWPRLDVEDGDGWPVSPDSVPEAVVAANCYLAGIAYGGKDLQPVLERGGRIKSEQVSTLKTEYFEDAGSRDMFTKLADMLKGYAMGLGEDGQAGASMGAIDMGRG